MVPAEEKPDEPIRKIPKLDRPVDRWVWHPFNNPAREDHATFSHWMKKKELGEVYAEHETANTVSPMVVGQALVWDLSLTSPSMVWPPCCAICPLRVSSWIDHSSRP